MSAIPTGRNQPLPLAGQLALLIFLPLTATALAIATTENPLYAVAAIAGLPVVYGMLRWPQVSTLAVVFILYTNAADVAVTFHGVPYVVGASFLLLLGIPILHHVFVRKQPLLISPVFCLIVVLGLVALLGAVTVAQRPEGSLPVARDILAEGVLLYFLVTNAVRSRETLRRTVWVLLLAGAFLGSLSLFQQLTRTYDKSYGGFAQMSNAAFETDGLSRRIPDEQPRLAGPIGEQNRYAQIMLMLLPLGLFQVWSEKQHRLRLAAIVMTILIAAGMILTFSRQAAVGFVVLVAIMVAMRYITRRQLAITLLAVLPLLLVFPQYTMRVARLEGVWALVTPRTQHQTQAPDESLKGRTTEMLSALYAYVDHPVLGVGPGMFQLHYQEYAYRVGLKHQQGNRKAHNTYLQIAAEEGTVGILCFLGILFFSLRDIYRLRKRCLGRDPQLALMATGLMLALLAYMVTAMFSNFAYLRFVFLILALNGAMSAYGGRWLEERSNGGDGAAVRPNAV